MHLYEQKNEYGRVGRSVFPGCEDWEYISLGRRIVSDWYDDKGPLRLLYDQKEAPAKAVKAEILDLMKMQSADMDQWRERFEQFLVYVEKQEKIEKIWATMLKVAREAASVGFDERDVADMLSAGFREVSRTAAAAVASAMKPR